MEEQTKHVLVSIETHPLNGRLVAVCSCGRHMSVRPTVELAEQAHRDHVARVGHMPATEHRKTAEKGCLSLSTASPASMRRRSSATGVGSSSWANTYHRSSRVLR